MLLSKRKASAQDHEHDQIFQHVVAERSLKLCHDETPESAGARGRLLVRCNYVLRFGSSHLLRRRGKGGCHFDSNRPANYLLPVGSFENLSFLTISPDFPNNSPSPRCSRIKLCRSAVSA